MTQPQPRANLYPGPCVSCGGSVTAGSGYLVGSPGRWAVRCTPCHQAEQEARKAQAEAKRQARLDALATTLDHDLGPRGLSLYPFQVEGVDFLRRHPHALLSDEMGLGKTVQVLTALPHGAPVIVVCPGSVRGVWFRECERWRPDLTPYIVEGRSGWRVPQPGTLCITSFQSLQPPGDDDQDRPVLIVDEAHLVKNPKARRTQLVTAWVSRSDRTWFLTGTPLLGRPFDLWGVLKSGNLDQLVFGERSWYTFLRLFNGVPSRWGGYDFGAVDPSVPDLLRRVMLRRLRSAVLPQLPTKVYKEVPVPLTRELLARCDNLWEKHKARLLEYRLPEFGEFSTLRAALAKSRASALQELVEPYTDSGTPLVVFSAHKAPLEALVHDRPDWGLITGDTPREDRDRSVAEFQAGDLAGVALTIQAGGMGLTLTRASHAIFVDLDWTPAMNAQAEDRLARIGQEAASIQITHLVSEHPLDTHLRAILAAKTELIEAAVESH